MFCKSSSGKKIILSATLLATLLIPVMVGSFFVNLAAANPGVTVNAPRSPPPTPIIKVNGLDTDKLTLTFSIQSEPWITPYGSYYGGDYEPNHEWSYSVSATVFVDEKLWSQHGRGTIPVSVSLEGLSNGWHTLEVIASASGWYGTNMYSPYDIKSYISYGSSGVIEFQVDAPPPSVQIQSLENTSISDGDFQLALQVNGRTLSWVGYSLDGKENVTVNQEVLLQSSLTSRTKAWTGNLTLTGLFSGSHSLIIYAKDQAGNTGASATTEFTVAKETQAWIAVAIIASAAVVTFGFLAYFLKRKRRSAALKEPSPFL